MSSLRVGVRVERLSKSGEGIAPRDGRSVFIPGALPGEEVTVEIVERGGILWGERMEITSASADRRPSFCALSEHCGGCDWIHLAVERQAALKEEIVLSTLAHMAGIARTSLDIRPVRAALVRGQRRRAVLHWTGSGFGYFARKTHALVEVEHCPVLVPELQALPGLLGRAWASIGKGIKELHLLARGPDVALAVFLSGRAKPKFSQACGEVIGQAGIRGVVVVPTEGPREILGNPLLKGHAPCSEQVSLYERPDVFAQAAEEGNRGLVKAALELGMPQPSERVLELYCGNGNFTFAFAQKSREVLGLEANGTALSLARKSAQESGLSSVRFIEGDVPKVCRGLIQEGARFDVVLVDPPRTGAKGLAEWCLLFGAKRVVYVSCEPASLARDAMALLGKGFKARSLQVLDLFPYTHHVETVVSFERSGDNAFR